MISAILEEKKIIKSWISEFNIIGIISDNRLGVRSKRIPSVFITHQLNVLTGSTTWITSKLHQNIIKKFTECWVPDFKQKPNLTGKLGHIKNNNLNLKYIGPLSRLEYKPLKPKYDLMVILSGPEPQRTILQKKLEIEVQKFNGNVIFIKGIIEKEQTIYQTKNVTFYNFMNSNEIETAFNESKIVLCRSGYTTIMDLAKLGKKAFFIPTPGQFEQEYLAVKLKRNGLYASATQDDFSIENLLEIDLYRGIQTPENSIDWKELFKIFE